MAKAGKLFYRLFCYNLNITWFSYIILNTEKQKMLSRDDKIWYVKETINQIYDSEGVDLDDHHSILKFAGAVHYSFKAVPFELTHKFYTRPGEYIDIQCIIPEQDGHDGAELNSTIT